MPQKIGFAHPCAGHFIQKYRHEIDTPNGKLAKIVFTLEGEIAGKVFNSLEEAEAWCKANPKPHRKAKD